MNTLIIYAHPHHLGHHGYFLKKIETSLIDRKINYELIDLYVLNYDPILKSDELNSGAKRLTSDITKNYQKKISAADKLIFIYPIWWQNMPAILKGFFDITFLAGFSFEYQKGKPVGLLQDKKAAIFSASGGPRLINKYLLGDRGIKAVVQNVLKFCGITSKGFSVGSARTLNDEKKEEIDKVVNKVLCYLYKK